MNIDRSATQKWQKPGHPRPAVPRATHKSHPRTSKPSWPSLEVQVPRGEHLLHERHRESALSRDLNPFSPSWDPKPSNNGCRPTRSEHPKTPTRAGELEQHVAGPLNWNLAGPLGAKRSDEHPMHRHLLQAL